MPYAVTTVNAVLNNEVDYMEAVPFDLIPMIKAND